MTDTFSFHPPPVSPSYNYPVLSEPSAFSHQRPASFSGYSGQQQEQESATGAYPYGGGGYGQPGEGQREGEANAGGGRRRPEDEGPFVTEQRSRGGSPGAPSSQVPYANHFQPGPFSYSNRGMLGANVRNTRPMTAPSSVSAPYFQGAIYSPTPHASSSYYPPQLAQAFSYQVDSGAALDADPYRTRGFSLPELAGLVPGGGDAGGPPDERGYSNGRPGSSGGRGGSSTFMYGLPPPAEGSVQDVSSPEQHSRPTTGDSRPNSSHDNLGRFGQRQSSRAPPASRGSDRSGHATVETGPYATMDGGPPSHFGESKMYNFSGTVSQTAKRPRRRYDEIERLYTCDYPGCQKAYGTLNHLNSHKTMQKHGPKSTPARSSSSFSRAKPVADLSCSRRRVQGASKSLAREQEGRRDRRRPFSSSTKPPLETPSRRVRIALFQRSPSPFDFGRRVPLHRRDPLHVGAWNCDALLPSRANAAPDSAIRIWRPPSRPHGGVELSLLATTHPFRPPPVARQRRLPSLPASTRHRTIVLHQRSHFRPLRRPQHLGWLRDGREEAKLASAGSGDAPRAGADDVWVPWDAAGAVCKYSGGGRGVWCFEWSEGSKCGGGGGGRGALLDGGGASVGDETRLCFVLSLCL